MTGSGPWWVERPGLLEEELAAFERHGLDARIDESLKVRGVLVIRAEVRLDGKDIPVEVVYPDLFPYVRVEVFAPTLALSKHQHPFNRNLCLIGRASENWDIDWTAADFLAQQLPDLLAAEGSTSTNGETPREELQGEPYSDYYDTQAGTVILVDSGWDIPVDCEQGVLTLRLAEAGLIGDSRTGIDGPLLRGAVTSVMDDARHTLAEIDPRLGAVFRETKEVTGRWLRLDAPPAQGRPPSGLADFERLLAGMPTASFGPFRVQVLGIIFPEEVTYRTQGDGWLVFVRAYRGRNTTGITYLAKVDRAGREDLLSRIPELADLQKRTVAVFGLGGIGAPIAMDLARAGVGRLRLLDHDRVDAGTAVRWPLGIEVAGRYKVEVLVDWMSRNTPYTQAEGFVHRLGGVRRGGAGSSDQEALGLMFDGVDLVIDATAEVGLHYPIAQHARDAGVPYLEASTRSGGWGGIVARVPADGDACWLCYQHHVESLRSARPAVAPTADPRGLVQPIGCADPTFTAAGFDVAYFANIATRLAVGTLSRASTSGYPEQPWDVAIVNLRDELGSPDSRPAYTFPLRRHSACPNHIGEDNLAAQRSALVDD